MSNELEPGTRVHVEFDGIVEDSNHVNSTTRVRTCEGTGYDHYIYLGDRDAYAVIEPTDWEKYGPPQVGDLWANGEVEYFVRRNWARPGQVVITSFDDDWSYYYQSDLEHFKALNPRLIRRRGLALSN